MDAARSLDGHLGAAVDDLLSLAALAATAGRPELALAASAALDPLIAFLDAGAPDAPPNRFYAYGVVARLALLAAAIELQENDPEN